jgi:hypothetical protein
MSALMQWSLAVLAVLGAFFVAGITGSLATDTLGFWHIPGAGFLAALAVVITAYLAAPRHKTLFSCGVFVVGAIAAWLLLEPSWYPESQRYGELAYQPTHLPVFATYIGGIIGLAIVGIPRLRPGA